MSTSELLWLKVLLNDIGLVVSEPMMLYCDNLANNSVLHARTKHVEINHYFMKEKIESK